MDFEEQARSKWAQKRKDADTENPWDEVPVTSRVFFEEFLGEALFPLQQDFVDNVLGTDPMTWDETYSEGIALYGKGSGKDRTAAKILLYVVYRLLCMKDPAKTLGLGEADKIEVANVCINARLAKDVFFKYVTILLRRCKNPKTGKNWFIEKGLNFDRDVKRREIEFPKNITAYSLDSEEYTAEGMNVFFCIFDEIAGFDVMAARNLYDALRSSMVSRFPKTGKILLLSYKRNDNDFMMTRFQQAEKEARTFRHGPYATWDVNLKRRREDFADDYLRDPEGSQRIFECRGSTSEGGFIKYKSRISQVLHQSTRQNPIVGDRITTVDLRGLHFKDWFVPVPQAEYFIHVDLAKGQRGGDACGFCMVHYQRDMTVSIPQNYLDAMLRDNESLNAEELAAALGKKKVGVVLDLILQIRAPSASEIMFEEIRALIERLRREYKFPIFKVSYDGWQSVESIAQLRKSGVNAVEQSVDKDIRAYNSLKNAIYEGVVESYDHPILIRELEELLLTKTGKVDHPVYSNRRALSEDGVNKGSKDVADAVAGAVSLALDRGKGGFSFGTGTSSESPVVEPKNAADQTTVPHPLRWESERLVRYGERTLPPPKTNPKP